MELAREIKYFGAYYTPMHNKKNRAKEGLFLTHG